MIIEQLTKCAHDIEFIRRNLLDIIGKGNSTDFLIIENLLHKTMDLKRDIDRFLCAKEIDNDN